VTKFKRKPKAKADAILSADWHIRPDTPICRTDNYFEALEGKIDFVFNLASDNECPILVSGDLGNKAQWPNWLLSFLIGKIEDGLHIVSVPGQHDLENHKLSLLDRGGLGVLYKAAILWKRPEDYPSAYFQISGFPYGHEITTRSKKGNKRHITMAHQMVIENKPLWPGQKAPKGHQLLKKFPEYDIILTGDNHNAFTVEHEGRWLVNPGSMMRMTADQADHRPRVYLWWAEDNRIEPVYLPIEQDVISRTHIEIVEDRDRRMEAYMSRVREDTEVALSYEDNLERYFNRYRTIKPVKDKVWENVG